MGANTFGLSLCIDPTGAGERWHFTPPKDAVVFERGLDRLVVVEGEGRVEWALLAWSSSETDESGAEYAIEAHGGGTSGSLREPRHTYFGEDGYVFYVDPLRLAWAFDCLRRWFDYPEAP